MLTQLTVNNFAIVKFLELDHHYAQFESGRKHYVLHWN